jgi:hypothetical protein
MRMIRSTTTAAITLALLIGSAVTARAQDGAAPQPPVEFTGSIACVVERHHLPRRSAPQQMIDIIGSSILGLTDPHRTRRLLSRGRSPGLPREDAVTAGMRIQPVGELSTPRQYTLVSSAAECAAQSGGDHAARVRRTSDRG